jgi:hypothetical protein
MKYWTTSDIVLDLLGWHPTRKGRWTLWGMPQHIPSFTDRLKHIVETISTLIDWDKVSKVPIDEAVCAEPFYTTRYNIIPWEYEYKHKE